MTLLPSIKTTPATAEELHQAAAERVTPFGQFMGANLATGFDFSLAGRALEEFQTPGLAGPTQDEFGNTTPSTLPSMTEQQYKGSRWYRDGIDFDPGMTEARAAALADSQDRRRYRESLIARHIGGAASPESYIPIMGPSVRAAMSARLGVLAGRAATGAVEGAIGNVIAAPLVYGSLNARGEDLGIDDLATDLALGAAVGGLFGTAGGLLERRSALRALRYEGMTRKLDTLALAADALVHDEPVDVSPLTRGDAAVQERVAAETPRDIEVNVGTEADPVIRVYHGTPHKFDRFDSSKIGTGEGAQSYGHGLYFAESKDVAESYKLGLATQVSVGGRQLPKSNWLSIANGDIDQAIKFAREGLATHKPGGRAAAMTQGELDELIALKNEGGFEVKNDGSLYGVDLKVKADELLDWDKPLSEQSPKVQDAFDAVFKDAAGRSRMGPGELLNYEQMKEEGAELGMAYRSLESMTGSPVETSRVLREAGIPGIRYLDQGSRTDGEGSRNIVLFDDKRAKIVERNGTPIREQPEPERPSVLEAASRKPPKDAAAELKQIREDTQIDEPPELADIAVLRRDGRLTVGDEAMLVEADELVRAADNYAVGYETLAVCLSRNAA
jgi:hypothetical protein